MKRTLVITTAALLAVSGGGAAAASSQPGHGGRPHRPASEHVPASVHTVNLVSRSEPDGSDTANVTVTGALASQLVHLFNRLRTRPFHSVQCDIAGGPEQLITFRTTRHVWRVKQAACTDVQVSRDGKRLPTLVASTAWSKAVSSDLSNPGGISGTGVATTTTVDPLHALAVAEAKRILRRAPVLAGATRRKLAPSQLLKGPPSYPDETGLVRRSRYWVTTLDASRTYHRLTAKTPAGFRRYGSGGISGPHDSLRFVADSLTKLPGGIADAELLIAVSPLKDGRTGIGVYAETAPQPPRPADEHVPTSVTSVALSWSLSSLDKNPLTRTITGSQASRLVTAFNGLKVELGGPRSCPLSFGEIQSATFVADGHTWVAAPDNCGGVAVTRDGKSLPELASDDAYYRQLTHALGLDAPALTSAQQVPDSVNTVKLVRTTPGGTTTHTAHGNAARDIVDTFDRLAPVRPGVVSCTATGTTLTATFATSTHTWVATEDPCELVSVTRDGKAQPTLADTSEWSALVTHALK